MGYIEKNLTPGEELLYRTGLHAIVMLGPLALGAAFAVAAAACAAAGFSSDAGTNHAAHRTAWLAGAGIAAVAGALSIGVGWTRRAGIEMAVTNKRLIVKTGILRRRTIEMMLAKVESVSVDQGVWGRIADYGTLVVRGTGGTHERFERIGHPLEFRRKAQEQIDRSQATPAPAAAPGSTPSSNPRDYAPPGSVPTQRFCGQCGMELPEKAEYCPRCGARRMG